MTQAQRFTVEKTAGVVQCECPPWLCPHPDGFRDVSEWVVVDVKTGDQGPLHDLYRDAKSECDRKNTDDAEAWRQACGRVLARRVGEICDSAKRDEIVRHRLITPDEVEAEMLAGS